MALTHSGGRRKSHRKSARKHTRKHARKHTRKHKSARKHKSRRRGRKGGLFGIGDPKCVSPGTTEIYSQKNQTKGTYVGPVKVVTKRFGVSRSQTTKRVCVAHGQGKWTSVDGQKVIEGVWNEGYNPQM